MQAAEQEQSVMKKGFLLGEWTVEPLAGCVSKPGQRLHVEPKLMDVLLCLVAADGETVSRDQLLSQVWQGVVVSEEALTRAISELRSLLGDTAKEKRYIRTLPKRGYCLIMPAVPLSAATSSPIDPAADTQAAAGQTATADNQQRPSTGLNHQPCADSVDNPLPWPAQLLRQFLQLLQTLVQTLGRVLIYGILVFCGLLAVGVITAIVVENNAEIRVSDGEGEPELLSDVLDRLDIRLKPQFDPASVNTIAVLPFANLSGDNQQDYFVDGLAEDIRNALITVPSLKVVARTSSQVFKNQALDVREIGKQLDADVLVEGTVRVQGSRLRATVQLTDARAGHPLWAGSFDRSMADVFEIQEEIAEEVASRLELQLSPEPRNQVSPKAYEKYLLGRHYWHQRTPRSLKAARREFREAIELQPDYAPAYSGLADAYTFATVYDELPLEEALAAAVPAVARALELDARLAEAHASEGIILEMQNDLVASRRAYERAVQLKPAYSMARMWLGNVLLYQGELSQAYDQYRQALSNDPLHPSIQFNYLAALQQQGRYDEALRLGDQFFEQSKSEGLLKQHLHALVGSGRYDEALDFIQRHNFSDEHKKLTYFEVINALIRLGEADRARALLQQQRSALDAWQAALLDMALALVERQYDRIADIAAVVETIDPETMLAKQALCESFEVANVARADYWRGLGAYAQQDYHAAEALFLRSQENGGGCWLEPDIELSLLLYRADVAGLLGKTQERQQLLHEIEQDIQDMRAKGWGHLPLQVSELAFYVLSADRSSLRQALQRMQRNHVQPMGVALVDPLLQRHLEDPEVHAVFQETLKAYAKAQERSRQKQLAKFGI